MSITWSQARFSPQHLVPAGLLLLMILVGSADFSIPGLRAMFPQMALMTIFYWSIYWPRLMPYWLLFIMGILQDALYGLPLGCIAFSNVLLVGLFTTFRRYFVNASFLALWFSFAVVAWAQQIIVVWWLSYYYGSFMLPDAALMQWLFSVLVYPSVQRLFFWIHVTLLRLSG